jgi:hypothetical protein
LRARAERQPGSPELWLTVREVNSLAGRLREREVDVRNGVGGVPDARTAGDRSRVQVLSLNRRGSRFLLDVLVELEIV